MSDSFNRNLAVFLTSCRESARKELTDNNPDYRRLLRNAAEYSKRIQQTFPNEADEITDALHALARMEINYLYFQGFRDCIKLYKRFDDSFGASRDFEKFFVL